MGRDAFVFLREMIKVQRFINELMSSNCYIIYDDILKRSIVVDPASEKCLNEIEFIDNNRLTVDYILLTHEHTDHTWGCNILIEKYEPKVICSEACKIALPKEGQSYFSFYYDNPEYHYVVKKVDYTIEELGNKLMWLNYFILFVATPGHSAGSVCFSIDDKLFTGDTIMQYKLLIIKKYGSIVLFEESVANIKRLYHRETQVYPGHGELFKLKEVW